MTGQASALRVYRPDLSDALEDAKAPGYRHGQVYHHLMHHSELPFAQATDLPLDLRALLEPLGASTLVLSERQDDPDGTSKLLLAAAADNQALETVIMRYARRTTVCVSTQIGCPLACAFCSTGSIGFVRDLSAAEIVDQVRAAIALLRAEARTVSNVVYMGMGEPLLNMDNVLAALRLLKDQGGLGFAARSLSVSTIGIPEGIRRLSREEPQVNLALSLHAPDEKLRSEIVPANRRYPLSDVLRATSDHFNRTHRKLFVEYLLLDGINDSPQQASALADLLRGRVVAVNLIPWNPAAGGFRPSPPAAAVTFRKVLAARGVEVTIRESRGARIAAACGQLVAGRPARRGTRPGPPKRPDQGPKSATGGQRATGGRQEPAGHQGRRRTPPGGGTGTSTRGGGHQRGGGGNPSGAGQGPRGKKPRTAPDHSRRAPRPSRPPKTGGRGPSRNG